MGNGMTKGLPIVNAETAVVGVNPSYASVQTSDHLGVNV